MIFVLFAVPMDFFSFVRAREIRRRKIEEETRWCRPCRDWQIHTLVTTIPLLGQLGFKKKDRVGVWKNRAVGQTEHKTHKLKILAHTEQTPLFRVRCTYKLVVVVVAYHHQVTLFIQNESRSRFND